MSVEDRVLKLLKETNKPYNVQGVSDMLASQGVKKSQAEKALDSLSDQGKIVKKEFGKTKIYFPTQEGLAELTSEEKAEKVAEINRLSSELKKHDEAVAALKKEVAAAKSSLSVDQLRAKFNKLQEQSESLNIKLAGFRSGAGPKISAADISSAENKLRKMLDMWDKRRSIFNNIWSEISENLEGKKQDLFEDIGVETDDAVGESSREYRELLNVSNKRIK